MAVQRVAPAAFQGHSPHDATWSHHSKIIDKFRALCHSDKALFTQAENAIKAKRVAEQWESAGRPSVDVMSLATTMAKVELDDEDNRQVDALYRRKIAFRDRLCAALGKLPEEGWDSFYGRKSETKAVPNTVRQFELASQA